VDIVLFSYFLERSQFKTDYLKLFHVAAQHGSEINILMMITNFINFYLHLKTLGFIFKGHSSLKMGYEAFVCKLFKIVAL